jgi:hypothetical protein
MDKDRLVTRKTIDNVSSARDCAGEMYRKIPDARPNPKCGAKRRPGIIAPMADSVPVNAICGLRKLASSTVATDVSPAEYAAALVALRTYERPRSREEMNITPVVTSTVAA